MPDSPTRPAAHRVTKSVMLSNGADMTPITQGGRSFVCIISTDEIDLSGDKVGQDWDLSVFRKNKKLLAAHQPDPPIGEVDWIEVREIPGTGNRRTYAGCTIFPEGTTEKGDEYARLIAIGGLGTVSVGFDCADAIPLDPARARGPMFYRTPRLLELSIVSLPCNTSAVIVTKAVSMNLTSSNPEKAARQKRVAEVIERGVRRQRAYQVAQRGREIAKEIAAAEKLAGPHPTDGMSTAERRRWAAERVARSAHAATGSLPAAEIEAQRNARHAASVAAHGMEDTKSSRIIRAGLADKKNRDAGHGGS